MPQPPPAAPRRRGPLLVGLLVTWALAIAWAVAQTGRGLPPVPAEAYLAGAVDALHAVADVLDAARAGGQPLPDEVRGAQALGVTYRRVDDGAFVPTARAEAEAIELEVRGDVRTLRGKGTEAYRPERGGEGGQ